LPGQAVDRDDAANARSAFSGAKAQGLLPGERRELLALRGAHDRDVEHYERRLRNVNQHKGEALAVCAHDLRSPLHVILSHAALVADGIAGPITPAQRKHLEAIEKQGRRMATLIEELLHTRHSGIDTLEIAPCEGDLGRLLRECARET